MVIYDEFCESAEAKLREREIFSVMDHNLLKGFWNLNSTHMEHRSRCGRPPVAQRRDRGYLLIIILFDNLERILHLRH